MADKRQLVIDKAEQLKHFLYSNTDVLNGSDYFDFRYFLNNYTNCIDIKIFFDIDFVYKKEYSFDNFLATPICVLANRIVEARDQYRRSKYGFDIDASTCSTYGIPKNNTIKEVIFNPPATIVFWYDGDKTVVKCENEPFDKEKGLAMAVCKKIFGNKGNYYNIFNKWIGE